MKKVFLWLGALVSIVCLFCMIKQSHYTKKLEAIMPELASDYTGTIIYMDSLEGRRHHDYHYVYIKFTEEVPKEILMCQEEVYRGASKEDCVINNTLCLAVSRDFYKSLELGDTMTAYYYNEHWGFSYANLARIQQSFILQFIPFMVIFGYGFFCLIYALSNPNKVEVKQVYYERSNN